MGTNTDPGIIARALTAYRAMRDDGWQNMVTGIGMWGRDKTRGNLFRPNFEFTQQGLFELYRGDALARRIIDVLPDDMIRAWFSITISETTGGENVEPTEQSAMATGLQNRLRDLRAKSKLKQALRWERLYGGSIVVIFADDNAVGTGTGGLNGPLSLALNEDRIKSVKTLKVYHRFEVTEGDIVRDIASRQFDLPEWYDINLRDGTIERIHWTRTLRFDGQDLPRDATRRRGDFFGDSVYTGCFDALSDFQMSYKAAAVLVADFSQTVMGIPGLHEMIIAKQDSVIQHRIGIQDYARSVLNAVLIDSATGETFERKATPVGGLAELLDRNAIRLSACTGIPLTKLMGVAPTAFAKEDVSGDANWDDVVASSQDDGLYDNLRILLRTLMLEDDSSTGGTVPDAWDVLFNPLTQETALEQAQREKVVAETDTIRIDSLVLRPSEVRVSRYTTEGQFSQDTRIDADVTVEMQEAEKNPPEPTPPPMSLETMQAQLALTNSSSSSNDPDNPDDSSNDSPGDPDPDPDNSPDDNPNGNSSDNPDKDKRT